jgi:two-component system cell cycle sensor histidine kinase/response regulator CckA
MTLTLAADGSVRPEPSQVLTALPGIAWTTDRAMKITSAAGSALTRLGAAQERMLGRSVAELLADEPGALKSTMAAHQEALGGLDAECTVSMKGLNFVCRLQPLRDASGAVIGVVGAALDSTRAVRLEEQSAQARKMESIGRLAGGIAHDFNNILTAILGMCTLMRPAVKALPQTTEDLDEIERSAQRAASLTAQLLAYSRKQTLESTVFDLRGCLTDLQGLLKRLIGEDIRLTVSCNEEDSRVRADRTQIEMVFMNLAVNARDAMPHGGELHFESSVLNVSAEAADRKLEVAPGRYVCVVVSDTGTGMDAATLKRLFEPYFTTKGLGRGTGLGLSTAFGILRQSRGHVTVSSEPGKGTTFKVYLPLEVEAATPPSIVAPFLLSAKTGERILLVEDDAPLRRLVVRILGAHGYLVDAVAGGDDAALAAREHKPDLLLTDVILPGENGKKIAERIRLLLPGLPVIYMSGYTENVLEDHGIMDPGALLIQKPFTAEVMLEAVRQKLDGAAKN